MKPSDIKELRTTLRRAAQTALLRPQKEQKPKPVVNIQDKPPIAKKPAQPNKVTPKPKTPRKKVHTAKTANVMQGPLNIILLGDPAAGKATQAAYLVKKYPLYDLDMGKELRQLQARDPKMRKLMEKTYNKGHVTQTEIVRKIFQQKIFTTPKSKGILFDGNPKQIGEAQLIYRWLKEQGRDRCILIYLSIPMAETCKRMRNRVEYFKGKFSKRADDNEAALKNRVKYYHKNIAGVLKFFKAKYPFKQISGLGSRDEVRKRIVEFISKFT